MATSGGSGGPTTNGVSDWWAATNSYSSKYRWWASHLDSSKPIGLFVWFHGDGAYEYNNPTNAAYLAGPDGIIQACVEQNLLLVVPLSPDDDGTITWWEWGSKTGNTQWAKELVQRMYSQYNIDYSRIFFGGFSGGAEFLTAQFLPYWGNSLQIEAGGAVVCGGGDQPSEYGTTEDPVHPFAANFPIFFRTGEDDTAANSSEGFDAVLASAAGRDHYAIKGHPVDYHLVPGHSHLLNGLYGGFLRELFAWQATAPVGPAVDLREVGQIFVGDTKVREIYYGNTRIWAAEKIYKFSDPGSYTIALDGNPVYMDVLVVGGGGGGGHQSSSADSRYGEGGTSGQMISDTWEVSTGEVVITVGSGGAAGVDGSSSVRGGGPGEDSKVAIGLLGLTATGGSGGAGWKSSYSHPHTMWEATKRSTPNPFVDEVVTAGSGGNGGYNYAGTYPESGSDGYVWVRIRNRD